LTFASLLQYAAAGSLTNLIDGRAKATRWAYDQYGRVGSKVDALGTNVFAYGYDADDRVTTRTDAVSRVTSFLYDAVANLTNVVYPNLTNRYAYDALNRLTNMVDTAGTTAFGYNTNGLVAFEDGPWADDTVSFDYNTARLRTGLTLLQPNASAWVQNYGYDSI